MNTDPIFMEGAMIHVVVVQKSEGGIEFATTKEAFAFFAFMAELLATVWTFSGPSSCCSSSLASLLYRFLMPSLLWMC